MSWCSLVLSSFSCIIFLPALYKYFFSLRHFKHTENHYYLYIHHIPVATWFIVTRCIFFSFSDSLILCWFLSYTPIATVMKLSTITIPLFCFTVFSIVYFIELSIHLICYCITFVYVKISRINELLYNCQEVLLTHRS
jgi:hypothetical protein